MAAKTKQTKTVKTKTPVAQQTNKTPAKKRESVAELKKQIENLKNQLNKTTEDYGNMLAAWVNMKVKMDTMLGEVLKGLFAIGIGPDELKAKCGQMFVKKVKAD